MNIRSHWLIIGALAAALATGAAETRSGTRVSTVRTATPPAPTRDARETRSGGRVFTDRVVSTPSLVHLRGMHSASQRGPTCNVYSMWMILHYYRYRITPTQIKKGAKDGAYKTSKFIEEKLASYDFVFLHYIPKQPGDFADVVKACIDNGIPLQWGVMIKYSPGSKARPNDPVGGHARVIWGYERDRRSGEVTKIIYGDSWGKGNLRKKMKVEDACQMTMSMHPVFPRDLDPLVAEKLMAIPGMQRNTMLSSPKNPGQIKKNRNKNSFPDGR